MLRKKVSLNLKLVELLYCAIAYMFFVKFIVSNGLKAINALIEYRKYIDEQYELYSCWYLGKLALAVLYACDNETARQSYEKIISKIDNLSKGNIGYIIRII